jgi:hypothetical protein
MLKQIKPKKRRLKLPIKKVAKQLNIYQFPTVIGLEDISAKLNRTAAEDLFSALVHTCELKPILDEEYASKAERMIEYVERAFENDMPSQVEYYQYILLILLKEYDDSKHIRASKEMAPHEFLKALLDEDGISQKSLVPECFPTESQVSEFLHQKKGRDKLSYDQAVSLGKKFKVDPLNFL